MCRGCILRSCLACRSSTACSSKPGKTASAVFLKGHVWVEVASQRLQQPMALDAAGPGVMAAHAWLTTDSTEVTKSWQSSAWLCAQCVSPCVLGAAHLGRWRSPWASVASHRRPSALSRHRPNMHVWTRCYKDYIQMFKTSLFRESQGKEQRSKRRGQAVWCGQPTHLGW